jgi:hypothetical protein
VHTTVVAQVQELRVLVQLLFVGFEGSLELTDRVLDPMQFVYPFFPNLLGPLGDCDCVMAKNYVCQCLRWSHTRSCGREGGRELR